LVSGFRYDKDEIRPFLRCWAACIGQFLPMFWDNLSVPAAGVKKDFLALDGGTNRLSRNVGRDLTRCATTQKSADLNGGMYFSRTKFFRTPSNWKQISFSTHAA